MLDFAPLILFNFIVLTLFLQKSIRRDDFEETKLSFRSVEGTLNRLKNPPYSNIPKKLAEINEALNNPEIKERHGRTLAKNDELYIGSEVHTDPDFSFHVFASKSAIKLVEENIDIGKRHYLMDGTFNVAPLKFSQLFIISVEFKNDVRVI